MSKGILNAHAKVAPPIGSFCESMLTEAQFQALNGDNWVLADGRSVAGTTYATVTGQAILPDCRGLALRGKNNGRADGKQNPDGEVALGTYQADQFGQHAHGYTRGSTYSPGANTGQNVWWGSTTVNSDNAGGNETRMKNITVNIFIRVN